MPWTDRSGPVPRRTEEELLALVRQKTQAAAGRRRQQTAIALAAIAVLFGGLITVVARGGSDGATQVRTVAGGLPSSLAPDLTAGGAPSTAPGAPPIPSATVWPTTSTSPHPPLPTTAAVPTTRSTSAPTTATSPAQATATTTTIACRNSVDPACGPFRWDPAPGPNQPMTVKVTFTPATPKVGDTVTFHVVVDDPDGSQLMSKSDGTVDYGDGTPTLGYQAHIDCVSGWGPWTPPDPVPVHEDLSDQHVYASPGSHTATFHFKSFGSCAYGPSEATTTVPVIVVVSYAAGPGRRPAERIRLATVERAGGTPAGVRTEDHHDHCTR